MISLSKTNYFRSNQLPVLSRRGIRNVKDLLFYFPRRYIDRSKPLNLKTTRAGDLVTFIGKIKSRKIMYGRKRRLNVICNYNGFDINLVFFHGIMYYQKVLYPTVEAAFSGTLEVFRGDFSMIHPEFEILTSDELKHTGKIIPLYKTTELMRKKFINSRTIRAAVFEALRDYSDNILEHIPEAVLNRYQLIQLKEALKLIHYPENMGDISTAKDRLAFDELLVFCSLMKEKKKIRLKTKKAILLQTPKEKKNWGKILIETLTFKLTNDQIKAVNKIKSLSYLENPFGALLQGDVGCGKTLVALLTAFEYMEEGIQTVFLAPTEILARQHYQNIINYTHNLPFVQIDLLLGKEKVKERKIKLDRLKRGDTLLVIGTHSLIQKDIEFANLGYVIIDEQHRFGVEQRETLRKKGNNPDLLAMTATPIPRSLTLTLYGDLEPVIIKEKPSGRKPIDTRLFEEKDLPRLYKGVIKYVKQGRQAYIIYPLIGSEDDPEDDFMSNRTTHSTQWASIMKDFEYLEKEVFKEYHLGLLHGRLSSQEKEKAMEKFKLGIMQILVSTTVVEVGVDIPNATVILIRNAEKFGLSQLHQLRGRVGRAEHQSFCILVKSENCTREGALRLQAMVESEDGFYLAQKDLEIRGPGELLGIKQAGVSEFRIADLRFHGNLAEAAQETLAKYPDLHAKITSEKNWQKSLQKGLILFSN